MSQKKIITCLIVLNFFSFFGRWFEWSEVTPVYAQVPDSGAQRVQQIELAKATNEKLDKIIELLEGGKLQVHVKNADQQKDAAR